MADITRKVKWPVKIFFFAHATVIFLWSLPASPPALRLRTQPNPDPVALSNAPQPLGLQHIYVANDRWIRNTPVHYYLTSTGVWQYWDMFAPNPSNLDYYIDAEVQFRDGRKQSRTYPRMSTMSIWDKYFSERYRKFSERVIPENSTYLWPIFAQRIALETYRKTREIPIRVFLHSYSRRVQWMDEPQSKEMKDVMFYEHIVDQAKVREEEYK
jgi:hypothetical protein